MRQNNESIGYTGYPSSFPKWALPIKLMEKTPKSKKAAKAKTE